jgi:hypothetical protein
LTYVKTQNKQTKNVQVISWRHDSDEEDPCLEDNEGREGGGGDDSDEEEDSWVVVGLGHRSHGNQGVVTFAGAPVKPQMIRRLG